ncbi:MAG: hypothetical protein JRE19_12230 [Deltaproteobacteria bacterium]|nr:hypothetical protein [Deltaproteobacteria bacterium]
MRYLFGLVLVGTLIFGCGDSDSQSFLIVVESSLHDPLEASFEQYAETMRLEGFEIHVEPWVLPGTVEALKALLFDYIDIHDIEGALLIGDLPAAWYEQIGLRGYEEFPTDIYLHDRDARWVDQDYDGRFDYHTPLELDIYTARLNGTPAQLQDYFERAHHYRHVGALVDVSAFIFIDDDWSGNNYSDALSLRELYSSIEIIQDKADSTLDNYLAKLTGDGAEFVYQKMHASPWLLSIAELDEHGEPTNSLLTSQAVVDYNLKTSFVNMTNCFAANFTEESNLAEAYTVGTDYGLAIIGSTKLGHQTNPRLFHENLADGMRWGEAYQAWFNEVGKYSDTWHLGVVLMGDPLLRVTGDLFPWGTTKAETTAIREDLERTTPDCGADVEPGTFEEYRQGHPEFFED